MRRSLFAVALLTGSVCNAVSGWADDKPAGDGKMGEKIYKRVCIGCHAVETDEFKLGPSLKGLIGRKSGIQAGSSDALASAGFEWSWDTFDKYMKDPKGTVPGTTMLLQINDVQSRADLYEYLEKVGSAAK